MFLSVLNEESFNVKSARIQRDFGKKKCECFLLVISKIYAIQWRSVMTFHFRLVSESSVVVCISNLVQELFGFVYLILKFYRIMLCTAQHSCRLRFHSFTKC